MKQPNCRLVILFLICHIVYITESRFRDVDSTSSSSKRTEKPNRSSASVTSSSRSSSSSSSASMSQLTSSSGRNTQTNTNHPFNTTSSSSDLCTQDRHRKLLCYCLTDDLKKDGRITKADCWIFQKNFNQNDTTWLAFNQQKSLKLIKFTVQPTGQLEYVPTKSLEMLHNLTTVNIEYAQIATINGYAFANLPNLESIILVNNQIESIAQNAFVNHEILKELHLQKNHINEIDRFAFRNLPQLKKLYLNSNNMSSLYEECFTELGKLEELDMSYNFIAVLSSDIFKGLGNLKSLKLTHNNLNFVGDTVFAELWSLQELDLDENNIERISQRALDGLNTLKVLNLSGNRIKKLDNGMLRGTPALLSINLHDNLLETLTYSSFEPIMENLVNRKSELLLTENNFICDCRLQWIFELKNRTRNMKLKSSLDDIECSMLKTDSKHYNLPMPINNDLSMKTAIIPESRKSYYDEHTSFKLDDTHHLHNNENDDNENIDDDLKHNEHFYDLMKMPPESLPCPNELKEPTELPLSRESIRMSDIRNLDISQQSNNHAESIIQSISNLWKLLPIVTVFTTSILVIQSIQVRL